MKIVGILLILDMKKDMESIIKEMEGEIAILNCVIPPAEKQGECTELRKGMRKAISYYLNRIKKLNEAIGSKEVFIDFMEWMRKYDFMDQVNMDELIVDEYLKSIKQRSAINS